MLNCEPENNTMAFQFIAILCLSLVSCGVAVRTKSSQTTTINLKDHDEMKIIQPIDDPMDYDCVDIYKQPSFNHPLLKNHKIQMEPSFQLKSKKSSSRGKGCPKGKVPIKRMDNSTQLLSYFPDQFHQFSREHPGEHYATLDTSITTEFHGAAAYINSYNPQPVKMGQISMAQIWLQNGPPDELNDVHAGWAVDGHQKTGCYNVLCPGFVQVDNLIYTGSPFDKNSVTGGQQYIINLKILQDKTSGHWWLIVADRKVGYWPEELFNHLDKGAFVIRYGGRTTNGPDGISPPMGSGQFANKFKKQSCFFARMKLVDHTFTEDNIPGDSMTVNVDSMNCYTLDFWGYQSKNMGETLTFGGPGGNCGV